MKIIHKTYYQCEKCGAEFSKEKDAQQCESRPITQDKGVNVGDIVKVTNGEGAGELAKVKRITVIDKDWGHYYWERYCHTVAIEADLLNETGTRFLTFGDYEVIKP